MKFLRTKTMQASWIQTVLPMPSGSAFRLLHAKALTLKIQEGLVWVTEEGVNEDLFLGPGEQYAVRGNGLVIISAETDARLQSSLIKNYLSHSGAKFWVTPQTNRYHPSTG
jgi:Protein of unknown function (DUF2917)